MSFFIGHTKANEFSAKEQQIKEYQSKLDQLTKENTELHQQFEHKQRENETKLNQLQNELDEKHQTNEQINDVKQQYEQTQSEFIKRVS
jgi:predicted nuclease with TOPRIM domain